MDVNVNQIGEETTMLENKPIENTMFQESSSSSTSFPLYAQILVGVFGGLLVLVVLAIAVVIVVTLVSIIVSRRSKLKKQVDPLNQYQRFNDDTTVRNN